MTKMEKFKNWVKKNPDVIPVVTTATAVTGFVVIVVVASVKQQKTSAADLIVARENLKAWLISATEWLNEETAKGNAVYRLDDGSYLTVPYDTKRELVIL